MTRGGDDVNLALLRVRWMYHCACCLMLACLCGCDVQPAPSAETPVPKSDNSVADACAQLEKQEREVERHFASTKQNESTRSILQRLVCLVVRKHGPLSR